MAKMSIPSAKVAACCVGLAAICALVVLVTDGVSTSRTTLESSSTQKSSDFKTVWTDWLHRINREVKAAVGISDGLSPEKKMALDGLLSGDLHKDLHAEKSVVSILDKKYADEEKDVKKSQNKPQPVKKFSSAKAAKPRAMVPSAPVKQAVSQPAPKASANEQQSPINLKLAAKIAIDDSKVAAAEQQAHLAANNLLNMDSRMKGARTAHNMHRRWKQGVQNGAAAGAAQKALVQKIQRALSMEMKRTRSDDPKIAEMTHKEEESWAGDLHKWGLSR